jgi:PX domain
MSLRKFRSNTRPGSKTFYEYDKGFSVDIPRTKEVKPSGLGKKPYTVYVIDLHHGEEEFQSDLRYSDFRKLHAVMRQRFPNMELPHLPSKKYVGNNTSDEFVQKR